MTFSETKQPLAADDIWWEATELHSRRERTGSEKKLTKSLKKYLSSFKCVTLYLKMIDEVLTIPKNE